MNECLWCASRRVFYTCFACGHLEVQESYMCVSDTHKLLQISLSCADSTSTTCNSIVNYVCIICRCPFFHQIVSIYPPQFLQIERPTFEDVVQQHDGSLDAIVQDMCRSSPEVELQVDLATPDEDAPRSAWVSGTVKLLRPDSIETLV